MSDSRSRAIKPRVPIRISRSAKRIGHLLRIEPKSHNPRVVLTSGNSPGNSLGLMMIVEAGEILIRIIIPRREGGD